jgi:hypothetical protein
VRFGKLSSWVSGMVREIPLNGLKTTTHTLPIDDVHPDDAVDEWVNVDDNGDQNNLPAAAPSVNVLPKKTKKKKKKKYTSSVRILAFVL